MKARTILIWGLLAAVIAIPVAAAGMSPLLAWREPIYIVAGFAGVIGLALMLMQPLLAGGYLPGLPVMQSRQVHRWTGGLLVLSVALHVGALWIVSPPDVIDVLLFRSPTPFSVWGVVAMWAVFLAAFLATFRRRLKLRPRIWRMAHTALAAVIVVGTVVHAFLIEGTMETVSKVGLSALVVLATLRVIYDLRVWSLRPKRAQGGSSSAKPTG
ncbi:MAG: ferric reductase-like transmembrane domain-containing protein [Pseudomonadota bacterium]